MNKFICEVSEQRVSFSKVTALNAELISQKTILEKKTEELRRKVDSLDKMIDFIIKFENFPVNETCPQKESLCERGHVLAVLLRVDLQKFISNHIKFYDDKYHGYWIGLHQSAEKNWLWIDGSNDTLGYWITEPLSESGPCAVMIPDHDVTASWDKANCSIMNKFICEVDVRDNEERTHISELTAQNEQLISQMPILENKTEELRRERDTIERMMDFIIKFENFSVKEICPQKKCNLCQEGWIQFQEKCYLFYNSTSPLLTWDESRQHCKDRGSDLVVVESLEEQAFGKSGKCALMVPDHDVTASWDKANCIMRSKFICEVNIRVSEQRAQIIKLTAQNEQLISQKTILEKESEQQRKERDNLERMMDFILKFDNCPVKKSCPQKECQPCQDGWIQFQKKCYLFSNFWLIWDESRQYCKSRGSDLVVVESQDEQKFINIHTKFYDDKYHGYWISLHQSAEKNWLWVDGSNDTLGYWTTEPLSESGLCAVTIPDRNVTASWDKANCSIMNKFICEVNITVSEQRVNLSEVTALNAELISQKTILKNNVEELQRKRDTSQRLLDMIIQFENFPVDEFCPEKEIHQ
ncbi:hypothetical protein LDENG_00035870 [Lucifuga dentata]|nr:hypothetical protein LDENG_00035870 [Lucifuga dentata]